MKKLVGYVRVSGRGQVDGDGLDRQRDAIAAFCQSVEASLDPKHIFEERGVSGTIDALGRPAFAEMVDALDADPELDGFVVERLDRLARDLMVQEIILKECRDRGIQVFAADQGQLLDMASDDVDPTRTLLRQMMGAIAQWEKTAIVRKLRAARERVRAEKGWCEGRQPFGADPKRLYEKKVLLKILQLRDAGFGGRIIKRVLDAEGVVSSKGRPLARSFVNKLLKRHGRMEPEYKRSRDSANRKMRG